MFTKWVDMIDWRTIEYILNKHTIIFHNRDGVHVCNFQSMKNLEEPNNFFLKFFWYITWFD